MSQSDMTIETSSVSGSLFGTDVQTNLRALASTSKGSSAPATPYDGQLWLDDSGTPWVLKIYDLSGTDWIALGNVNASTDLFTLAGFAKGADIASASPLVIGTDGNYFDVTGTTGFAAMTVAADRHFFLQFDGALTMTHHATNLDLPGEANITTAAGDVGEFYSTGANTVQCVNYTKADGTAVNGMGPATTDTLTNKTFDANGTGNSLSNVDVADIANGTDGELITWDAAAAPATVSAGSSGQVLTSNGAGAAPTFQAAAGGPSQATQAAIEAETNENTYIPPDLLKHHPGIAKGWVTVDCIGTVTIKESYNITSVTDSATGEFIVNWNVNFSSAEYCVLATCRADPSGNYRNVQVDEGTAPAAGTCPIETWAVTNKIDLERIYVAGFGDQA